ncbi:MAG: DUF6838 family protein [Alkaliphilus sp.]
MVNNIVNAIAIALRQEYPLAKVYTDAVHQGLVQPSFYIMTLQSSQEQKLGNRYYREHYFDIHYFSDSNNNAIHDVASALYGALEDIAFLDGDLIRASKTNYEIIDGVLHFFVHYNMHLMKVEVLGDNMETLAVNSNVKYERVI